MRLPLLSAVFPFPESEGTPALQFLCLRLGLTLKTCSLIAGVCSLGSKGNVFHSGDSVLCWSAEGMSQEDTAAFGYGVSRRTFLPKQHSARPIAFEKGFPWHPPRGRGLGR